MYLHVLKEMTEPKPLFRKKIDEIDNIIIRKNNVVGVGVYEPLWGFPHFNLCILELKQGKGLHAEWFILWRICRLQRWQFSECCVFQVGNLHCTLGLARARISLELLPSYFLSTKEKVEGFFFSGMWELTNFFQNFQLFFSSIHSATIFHH